MYMYPNIKNLKYSYIFLQVTCKYFGARVGVKGYRNTTEVI